MAPKAAVKHKNCTHCEITDNWDDYDRLFHSAWQDVSIEPTRFIDWDTVRKLGFEVDLREMITELGLGHMDSSSYDLYPELVRQFMATVQVYYTNERVKSTNEDTLIFFIRGIRYMLPLLTLCKIYGFENYEYTCCIVPAFSGQSDFWELLAA